MCNFATEWLHNSSFFVTLWSWMESQGHSNVYETADYSHVYPQRRNVTTAMVGLRNGHTRKNLTKNGEPQRYIAGERRRKRRRSHVWNPPMFEKHQLNNTWMQASVRGIPHNLIHWEFSPLNINLDQHVMEAFSISQLSEEYARQEEHMLKQSMLSKPTWLLHSHLLI